jgi:hypothetical protein
MKNYINYFYCILDRFVIMVKNIHEIVKGIKQKRIYMTSQSHELTSSVCLSVVQCI